MPRQNFEFERGKGLYIDWQQENVAYFGARAAYAPSFKPGRYRPTLRRGTGPLGWYQAPGANRWHLYLQMRDRIGHTHHKGIRPPRERY